MKIYEYDAVIQPSEVGKGGAFVAFPYDVRAEFGKGRVKVHATFDGEPYDGSVVNMGANNADGSVCYIIGVLKDIRAKIGKQVGDSVHVIIRENVEKGEDNNMENNDKKAVVVPDELTAILSGEDEARAFFESLTDGYKRGYCDWVGGAKQVATRQTRAEKALVMLKNKQKTLKT